MPLIIVSGFPCCGKTTYCFQLEAYLKRQGIEKIIIINEETENIDKRVGYLDAFNEKKTRGALKSAIDHALDAETFVILDSLNYIKGYRYELFCIARSLRTPHCCVWIQSDEDLAVKWNQSRSAQGYDDAIMLELRRRFEAPNEKNRWDFPLFRVYTVPLQSEAQLSAAERSNEPTGQVGDISCAEKVLKCDKTEAVMSQAATTAIEKPVPQTLTSTKGQIDINCLAIEKTVNIPFRSDKAPEEPLKPISSSWRPKVRSETKAVSNRTFVSLGGETSSVAETASTHTVLSIDPSVLSISGSIPVMIPIDQQSDPQEVMHQMYLHLTNVSQIAAPNSSTISVLRVNADLLHLLDRTSQLITQRIVAHQAENVEGTPLIFQDFDRTLALHRHVGLAELQRHRRQFVKTHSNMPASASTSLGSSFIDCLATYL